MPKPLLSIFETKHCSQAHPPKKRVSSSYAYYTTMLHSSTHLCDELVSTNKKNNQSPQFHIKQSLEELIGSLSLAVITCPDSDLYSIESSANNVPHGGCGKYLWVDGCTYERRRKAIGNGKFSWPSVGGFKSWMMDGFGTFVGDTYSGAWSLDRKHRNGEKRYVNGDLYEVSWRKNKHDGHGRYARKNGNEYRGEWKNGVSRGTLIWSNGIRYDGQRDNGVPKGNGVFSWPYGGCYVGNLSKDKLKQQQQQQQQHLSGTCYSGISEDVFAGEKYMRKRSSSADFTCDTVEVRKPFGLDLPGEAMGIDCSRPFKSSPYCSASEAKKAGQIIVKGHKHYNLMLNLQLGIRHSVGKEAAKSKELKHSDFDPKEKIWTRFPSEGCKTTPPHHTMEFRWKDYCPVVFRCLRKLFQVDPADYMLAICGNDSLRELSSPGKSGSTFYLTQDERFMIKTVKKSEAKVLIRMLSCYYHHVSKYKNTLVTKFYGVHCVKPVGGQKTRFIMMGNLFCSGYPIHKRFDLKGSSHGRSTDKHEEMDETTTLKDLDLNFKFRLQRNWYTELIKQIELDCKFLESERIMDYSLLVGVHFCNESTVDKMGLSPFLPHSGKSDNFRKEKFMRRCQFLEAELQSMDGDFSCRKSLIRLGANMPARAERMSRKSDADQSISNSTRCNGEEYEVVLYFGIIDILQDYDISKKLEHAYKSLQVSPSSISSVDPKLYAKRFKDFIGMVFVEDV